MCLSGYIAGSLQQVKPRQGKWVRTNQAPDVPASKAPQKNTPDVTASEMGHSGKWGGRLIAASGTGQHKWNQSTQVKQVNTSEKDTKPELEPEPAPERQREREN